MIGYGSSFAVGPVILRLGKGLQPKRLATWASNYALYESKQIISGQILLQKPMLGGQFRSRILS
jgi:hypothetical protein